MEVTMNETGFFEGADAKFETVYDWDMWQRNILMDMTAAAKGTDSLITEDDGATLYEVHGDSKTVLGEDLKMSLCGDRLEFTNGFAKFTYPMTGLTAMAVAHTSVLFFTCAGTYYEVHNKHIWPANKYFALHRMICGMKYV